MFKPIRIPAVALLSFTSFLPAQQNSIVNNVFRDPSLHFSYPIPKGLTPYDADRIATNLHQPASNANEFIVFAAKDPKAPFGVVLLAERTGTDRKPALTKPDDFIDALLRTRTFGIPPGAKRSHYTNHTGIAISRLDWQTEGQFLSAVVFQSENRLICMKFNAPSAAAFTQMTETVNEIKRIP